MSQNEIIVTWTQPGSYDDAKDFFHCVYIHERCGRIFYVGEANKSWFGGSSRRRPGYEKPISPRYGPSYRHLIDALLITGSRLFIGRIEDTDRVSEKVKEVEKHLRWQLKPELDRATRSNNLPEESPNQITHSGNVPPFLLIDA